MKHVLLVAVALSGGIGSLVPALAQAVISYPEVCAQFYPNANCQNYGPGNPYTGDDQRRSSASGAIAADSFGYDDNSRPVKPQRIKRSRRSGHADGHRRTY